MGRGDKAMRFSSGSMMRAMSMIAGLAACTAAALFSSWSRTLASA